MRNVLFFAVFQMFFLSAWAQKTTTQSYIDKHKNDAIQNMQQNGIPASITLAQAILESGSGTSDLATKANNHFGIKCHGWQGDKFFQSDDKANECFRKYDAVIESYNDHAEFLSGRSRYSGLFSLPMTDYKSWARGLEDAGYATNNQYAELLIGIIEKYQLYKLDAATNIADNSATNTDANATNISVPVITDAAGMVIELNGKDAIIVATGQTKASIALDLDIKQSKLENFNELGSADEFMTGDIIYLQRKRCRAQKKYPYHIVKAGESLYSISQKYGIRLKRLIKMNDMGLGSEIRPGDKLILR